MEQAFVEFESGNETKLLGIRFIGCVPLKILFGAVIFKRNQSLPF